METRVSTALLVEDDPLFRAMIRDHLVEGMKLRVVEAGESRAALQELQREVPDLVILDLMLPVVSGFAVCAAIRAAPATRKVPVLMMSARNSPQDRARAEEVGASAYLVKPFTRDELSAEIRALLFPKPRRARK